MNKSDYFLITPLNKWTSHRMIEYLINKHINLTPAEKEQILSGNIDFCNPKIRLFKKIFVVNGVNIYLILRERIEKEETAINKVLSSPLPPTSKPAVPFSPPLPPTSKPAVPFSPPLPPTSKPVVPFSPPLPPTSKPVVHFSPPLPPTSKHTKPLIISELVLEPRAIDVLHKFSKFEKLIFREFIDRYPPLLWKIEHFNYFIETLSIIGYINTDIDELIFYTPDQFDKLFPGNGKLIYDKLREKFIKKDISYIKPKPYN